MSTDKISRASARRLLQIAQRSACIAFALTVGIPATAQEDDPLVRGPYLQALTATSVDVLWTTRGVMDVGIVTVLLPDGTRRTVEESPSLTCRSHRDGDRCHRVLVNELLPDTVYEYEIHTGDVLASAAFKTPPKTGTGVVRFAALGDSGTGNEDQLAVARVLDSLAPEAILHTGDLAYEIASDPADRIDKAVFEPYRELLSRASLFPARGNHDKSYPFADFFHLPNAPSSATFGSFDLGPVHVVVLDTTQGFHRSDPLDEDAPPTFGERQLAWLCGDLTLARSAGQSWIVVVMHEPMFSIGPQGNLQGNHWEALEIRNTLAPIFDEHDVDIVMQGDDHLYLRTPPLVMTNRLACGTIADTSCNEDDPTICYAPLDAGDRDHYAHPNGTIYLVTGGGGRTLYGRVPRADARLEASYLSAFHAMEFQASPAMLRGRAVGVDGETIDSFTISKHRFLRGDVNFDAALNLADPVLLLNHLFSGTPVDCPQVGDINGSGALNVADAVYFLHFLFLGAAVPPAPYPECGPAPDASEEFCVRLGCSV